MGAQFFLVGERKNICTDMTKLTVTLCNFVNVPKNSLHQLFSGTTFPILRVKKFKKFGV